MKLTKRQGAIISLYTGILCGQFSDMHEYAEELSGGPIFSHQFGDAEFVDHLKFLARKDFLAICAE